jgi:hypothetical protein
MDIKETQKWGKIYIKEVRRREETNRQKKKDTTVQRQQQTTYRTKD